MADDDATFDFFDEATIDGELERDSLLAEALELADRLRADLTTQVERVEILAAEVETNKAIAPMFEAEQARLRVLANQTRRVIQRMKELS